MNLEKRHAYFKSDLKVRAETEGKKYIEGYFIVFNQQTELWPGTFEQIAPQAADNSLKENDIRCLFNHNSDFVLGRSSANTLELKADSKGLLGTVEINEADQAALDVYARVQRGDITGCSFGFYPRAESYEEKEDGITVWTVEDADIHEISICTFPAYPQTEVQARKEATESEKQKRFERQKADLIKKMEVLKNA